MALQVWLPLNGDLENRGLSNATITYCGAPEDNDGKIGKCRNFNNNYIIGDNGPLSTSTTSFSIAFWVKYDNLSNYHCMYSQRTATGEGITVWKHDDHIRFDDGTNIWESTYVLTANVWTHIVAIRTPSFKKIYINGELKDSTTTVGTLRNISTKFVIGKSSPNNDTTTPNANYLLGKLNDVRVYDHCLSAKEIKEISQALVLHYKLDSIKNNILPPGIELYDSIQGDGNSIIYTSIPYDSTKSTYKIKCKFSQPANVSRWDSVFTAYTDENSKTIRIIRGNSNNLMYMYYNNKAGNGNPVVFNTSNANIKEVTITSTNVVCIENGTTDTHGFGAPSGTDTQSTFDLIRNSKSVIYYWTIWDGNVMLGNFLPATFYGEPGMWDTVTKRFFHNGGTGTFILGNKITIKEYEYLQCDTSSYIKSGVFPTTSTNFEMKYAANAVSSQNVFFGCSTVLAYNSGNNFSMDILANGPLLYTFKNKGYYTAPYTVTANTPFITKLFGSTFTVNNVSMSANRHTSHPNLEIYLFGHNVNGAINPSYPPRVGKIYYCKFWEGDTLIRDFVPVSYNDTLGLFDKVELKFYPNAGSGTFTAGTLVSEIVEDCSGYGHDGTVTGDISMNSNSARYKESSFITAGLTNYVRSPIVKVDEKGITMSIWIRSSDTAPTGSYHMPFEGGNYGYGEMSIYKTGYLRGGLYVNGTRYVQNSTSTVLLNGQWHMITMTYNGTIIKRYIDGVLDNSTSVSGILNNTSQEWYLGRYGTDTSYESKNMYLSDARLYATALSDDDVMHLYKTSASIDNLARFHTFEIGEKNHTPSIQKDGETIANNFIEIGDRIMIHTDGSVWLHVLHHNNPSEQIFSAANCWNYDNGASLYSALWLLKNNDWMYNGRYELLAKEQLTSGAAVTTYRWTQTSNPALTTSITGFTALEGAGAAQFKGLLSNGSYGAMHNGTTWYSCFGAYNRYQGGCPGFTTTVITTGCLDLYIRIPEITAKGATSSKAAIYQTAINASKFLEV